MRVHVDHRQSLISTDLLSLLSDFGFARALARPGSKNTDYVATRWYRAPELLVGDVDYGKAVDIWAAGSMFAEILCGQPLFAGESDIDQLYQIMKCLGPLTPKHQEIFSKNQIYVGVKLPVVKVTEPLAKKFPNLDKAALSLLKACLRYDPEERDSCSKLLAHPYFHGFEEWFRHEHKLALLRDKEDREASFREARKRTNSKARKNATATGGADDSAGTGTNPASSPREDAPTRSRGGSGGSGDETPPLDEETSSLQLPSAEDVPDLDTGGTAPLVLDQLGSGHSARGSKDVPSGATAAAVAVSQLKLTHSQAFAAAGAGRFDEAAAAAAAGKLAHVQSQSIFAPGVLTYPAALAIAGGTAGGGQRSLPASPTHGSSPPVSHSPPPVDDLDEHAGYEEDTFVDEDHPTPAAPISKKDKSRKDRDRKEKRASVASLKDAAASAAARKEKDNSLRPAKSTRPEKRSGEFPALSLPLVAGAAPTDDNEDDLTQSMQLHASNSQSHLYSNKDRDPFSSSLVSAAAFVTPSQSASPTPALALQLSSPSPPPSKKKKGDLYYPQIPGGGNGGGGGGGGAGKRSVAAGSTSGAGSDWSVSGSSFASSSLTSVASSSSLPKMEDAKEVQREYRDRDRDRERSHHTTASHKHYDRDRERDRDRDRDRDRGTQSQSQSLKKSSKPPTVPQFPSPSPSHSRYPGAPRQAPLEASFALTSSTYTSANPAPVQGSLVSGGTSATGLVVPPALYSKEHERDREREQRDRDRAAVGGGLASRMIAPVTGGSTVVSLPPASPQLDYSYSNKAKHKSHHKYKAPTRH